MNRLFIALILIPAIVFQVGMKIGIVAHYTLNKDFIAEVLCINKDKPKLNCNGKCYLAQKLKEAEEKENKSSQVKAEVEILSTPPHQQLISISQYLLFTAQFTDIVELYQHLLISALEKPPQA